MSRPGFIEGVAVALAACLGGGALHGTLAHFISAAAALSLSVALLSLGYIVYLLYRSPRRSGRAVSLGAWLLLTVATWELGAGVLTATQLVLVWPIRVRSFQEGALAALADLGLIIGGLGAALWVWPHTGSFALALWCFFLTQALFSALPSGSRAVRSDSPDPASQRFERAYQGALGALRKL